MTTQRPCRAADETKCPYHGAVMRMEIAYRKGDIDGYLKARDEADAAAGEESQNVPALLDDDIFDDDFDDFDDDDDDDFDDFGRNSFKHRARFLKKTAAVPTPMEAFALWLSVWQSQGGEVRPLGDNPSDYNRRATVIGKGNTIKTHGGPATAEEGTAYDDISWSRWTPTKQTDALPVGYGSASMTLLLLPDVVPQNLQPTSGDRRAGWEFGHTTVHILRRDPSVPGGLVAETNHPGRVSTYKDVETYRRRKSVTELVAAISGLNVETAPVKEPRGLLGRR